MKKSYIKIILFIFTLSIAFFLNIFKFKLISQVKLNIILLLSLGIIYLMLGFEKDRHRYTKDIILEIIIVLITFFLIYYLGGILIGFARNNNYWTINSLINIILPIVVFIFIKEILRYQLLVKSSESKILITLVCFFFILLDNVIPFASHVMGFNRETFLLVALTFIPSITENILCTYLDLKLGYKPGICYLLIIHLYKYLLPVIPNPNEYLYSIIFLLLPLIVLLHIKSWFNKDRVQALVIESYRRRKNEIWGYMVLGLLVGILVYGVSGYFRYYAIAVASGSMEPNISKGDVVVVDKGFNNLAIGDILAYKYNGKIVVHRIYKIIEADDEYFIYTKGDANNSYDKYKITKDMFIGIVKFKIPLIGYPTVLLNERW